MAIDLKKPEQRAKLARAIKRAFEMGASDRARRADLINIYADRCSLTSMYLRDRREEQMAYLNLFALFVRGHEISLAYRAPTWAVNARKKEGKGFDKNIQAFLRHYACILNFTNLAQQWAIDSAFGRAVAKIITSIAPKGITSAVAPRAYRINPDHYIPDRSAPSLEEVTYSADVYFVDLDEAKNHEPFKKALAKSENQRLQPWSNGNSGGSSAHPYPGGDTELFATDQCRLIDVYIPSLNIIATWEAPSDDFGCIASYEPLQVIPTVVSPHLPLDMLAVPDSLEIVSRLGQLRPLHLAANDNFSKAVRQSEQSKRNPIAKMGDEQELNAALASPDGEATFVTDPAALGLYTLPGADPSVLGMANIAAAKFGEHAGNLATQLGIDPGAGTARQTQALIGQITQSQAVDRAKFDQFLAEVGKRLSGLAFADASFALDYATKIPGTRYWLNSGWAPPHLMPRIGTIDDYTFETVAMSTAFRSPQEKIAQLDAASKLVFQLMNMAAMGAPIDIETALEDVAEAYDLVPNLQDWWNGQPPSPREQANNVYQSMASPGEGSTVQYQGVSNGGGAGGPADFGFSEQPGGLSLVG